MRQCCSPEDRHCTEVIPSFRETGPRKSTQANDYTGRRSKWEAAARRHSTGGGGNKRLQTKQLGPPDLRRCSLYSQFPPRTGVTWGRSPPTTCRYSELMARRSRAQVPQILSGEPAQRARSQSVCTSAPPDLSRAGRVKAPTTTGNDPATERDGTSPGGGGGGGRSLLRLRRLVSVAWWWWWRRAVPTGAGRPTPSGASAQPGW